MDESLITFKSEASQSVLGVLLDVKVQDENKNKRHHCMFEKEDMKKKFKKERGRSEKGDGSSGRR